MLFGISRDSLPHVEQALGCQVSLGCGERFLEVGADFEMGFSPDSRKNDSRNLTRNIAVSLLVEMLLAFYLASAQSDTSFRVDCTATVPPSANHPSRNPRNHSCTWPGELSVRLHGAQAAIKIEHAIVCVFIFDEEDGGVGNLGGCAEASKRDSFAKLFWCRGL